MSAPVTQWFIDEQPVHSGLYETFPWVCGTDDAKFDATWSGLRWEWCDGSPCYFQSRWWRGLADKPGSL